MMLWLLSALAQAAAPDWNASEIAWYDYQQGMAEAKQSGKPVMLIFYADWCPTCHAYQHLFARPDIVALAKQLVMIRVNVDREGVLSKQYSFDGTYVPRTFALTSEGALRDELYPEKRYRYFIKSSEVERFKYIMEQAAGPSSL